VIELHSRRVQIRGSTPYPDEAFVINAPQKEPPRHPPRLFVSHDMP